MPTGADPAYSRAFERFVASEDDLEGLIAYALYKQNIQQRSVAGLAVQASADRDPAPAEQKVYRGLASRIIDAVGNDAVERTMPTILEHALLAAQRDASAAMIAELRRRTGLSASIVTGVVVWLVTIGLTVLLALAEPDWVRNLVAHVGKAG